MSTATPTGSADVLNIDCCERLKSPRPYRPPTIWLESYLEVGKNYGMSKWNAKVFRSLNTHSIDTMKSHKSRSPSKTYSYWGYHKYDPCPATDAKFKINHQTGHFATVCRSMSKCALHNEYWSNDQSLLVYMNQEENWQYPSSKRWRWGPTDHRPWDIYGQVSIHTMVKLHRYIPKQFHKLYFHRSFWSPQFPQTKE